MTHDPDKMLACLTRIRKWLTRLAEHCEESAKDTRFPTLSDAHAADAKNYRAVIRDIDNSIK